LLALVAVLAERSILFKDLFVDLLLIQTIFV
jgi:hypothetical protein